MEEVRTSEVVSDSQISVLKQCMEIAFVNWLKFLRLFFRTP
jgi:hypothetical protein